MNLILQMSNSHIEEDGTKIKNKKTNRSNLENSIFTLYFKTKDKKKLYTDNLF